jgi:hypothetical protein
MRRISIMGLCLVGVLVFAAMAASAASAKTVLVAKTAKGPLQKGATLTAFSSNLIFVTSAGNLECSENTLTGTLESNEAAKDKGKVTTEVSKGKEAGGLCKTSAFGPTEIESSGFPWPVEFTTKGITKIKGTKKIIFTSTFPKAGDAKCTFEASKVESKFNTSGPVTIKTTKQIFKRSKKGSAEICPEKGELSGEFSLTSGGEVVESELRR